MKLPVSLICVILLNFMFSAAEAQYISAYDKNGNVRTAASKSAEEARNRQNNKPSTPAPSSTRTQSIDNTPRTNKIHKPYVAPEKSLAEVVFEREETKRRTLAWKSKEDFNVLPELYKAYYTDREIIPLPLFYMTRTDPEYTDLDNVSFWITRACIFLGNYSEALNALRRTDLVGRKLYIKQRHKEADDFEDYMNAYRYINYMSGKCFMALNMPDSAKKCFKLAEINFNEEWNKLYNEGAPHRAKKIYYDPRLPVTYADKFLSGDCINGHGERTWKNGNRYMGTFKTGLPHGNGIMYFANGDIYTGQFKNGIITGEGVIEYIEGTIYKGGMLNSKTHGYGKVFNASGVLIYEGEWHDNKKDGKGKLYNEKGELIYSGNFSKGKQTSINKEK